MGIQRLLLLTGVLLMLACQRKSMPVSVVSEQKRTLFEGYFIEANKHFINGKYGEAQGNFEKAASLMPEDGATNFMLCRLALGRNELNKAVEYGKVAVKADDKNKYYYLMLAKAYEQKMEVDEAIKVYKKLLEKSPGSEEYLYDLAGLYVYQRNYAEAIRSYKKIEEYFGRNLETTRSIQQIYLRENKLEEAFQEGESLMKAYPDDNEIKIAQAELLLNNKREDDAIRLLMEVIKEEPENPRSHLILADVYQMKGESIKAEEEMRIVFSNPDMDLDTKLKILEDKMQGQKSEQNKQNCIILGEKILKVHNSDARAHAAMGEVWLFNNQKKEAIDEFVKAKNIDKANFNLWLKLLQLDAELNRSDSLITHSEQALELFPNQAVLWLYNGMGYSQKKSYQTAVDAFEEGRKLAGNNQELKNYFNIHLGDTYHYTKEYTKSDEAYEEVLKVDKNNDHVLNNYSYFLSLRKEKLNDAKSMSERLVKKYPSEATYLDTHAWVLYMLKEYEQAKKYLEVALENNGANNGTIVEHYGDVLYQLGEKNKALEQWKKAQKLGDASEFIDKKVADGKLYE
ncbi:MAG: tetratricopeptide repeat protein [Cytophagaceae bacterium]|jgi:tetratricopeptide (TPR) repeat protein|nr:tetratricopeptide repeat protein [Cytophagaceae bacterium]